MKFSLLDADVLALFADVGINAEPPPIIPALPEGPYTGTSETGDIKNIS